MVDKQTKSSTSAKPNKNNLEHKYQSMTQYEHVVKRPDTYIGSISRNRMPCHIAINTANGQPLDENTATNISPISAGIRVKPVDTSNGLEKIFDEIIVNANDNKNRMDSDIVKYTANNGKDPRTGEKIPKPMPMTYLKVNFHKYSDDKQPEKWAISVENDGNGIDVAIHPKEKVYIPQMIFGKLLTSGNYDDEEEKITGGKNGYGAKLTNIFSDYFCIETVDHTRKMYYKQIYRNRMLDVSEPEITENYTGKPYTRITFIPRYEVFDGMTDLTDDVKALFIKRIYDMVFCSQGQIKVYVNNKLLPIYKNAKKSEEFIKRYIAMYMNPHDYLDPRQNNDDDDDDDNNDGDSTNSADGNADDSTSSADGDADDSTSNADDDNDNDEGKSNTSEASSTKGSKKHGVKGSAKSSTKSNNIDKEEDDYNQILSQIAFCSSKDRWQIGACMSTDYQFHQVSFVNGIHTTKGGKHVDYVLREITKLVTKYIKMKKHLVVRESLIRDNISIFINSIIVNPNFDSQSKDTLTSNSKDFGSLPKISDEFIATLVSNTGIIDRILSQNEFQDNQALKKTDGKKNKRLNIEKLIDADKAGTKFSKQCTLILTEGDSAKASAVAGISSVDKGNEYYGVYPLRGKLMNTRESASRKIASNKEISDMKQILGLKESVTYTNENLNELRYGRIMIMTDQDVDGSHIKGLLINWLSSHYPSLLKVDGFITSLMTPIVKVWSKTGNQRDAKKNSKKFYSIPDYETWVAAQPSTWTSKWHVKYYKGLGTSDNAESREYFQDNKLVVYKWDNHCLDNFDKAFNKGRANDRKDWLTIYDRQELDVANTLTMSLSEFIDNELIEFSMYDNHRSIPHVMDGLKPSQRKIIYSCFKRNLTGEIKVSQLAGYVAEHSAYHHGETSLNGTIVGLSQDFVGTNNINLLQPIGQFGSRLAGGKDNAATRYIFTSFNPVIHSLFSSFDNDLLKYVEDDGELVEPEYYAPIIPLALVNGLDGIGTGWSTNQPQYNPLDLVYNLRAMICNNGKRLRELRPWYRGYKANYLIEHGTDNKGWVSRGLYNILSSTQVEIVELPIGIWSDNYKEKYLEPRAGNGKTDILREISCPHKPPFVRFVLTFAPGVLNPLLKAKAKNGYSEFENMFKLVSRIPTNATIPLFKPDGKLHVFRNVKEMIDCYYKERMNIYNARREHLLNKWAEQLSRIDSRVRFITDVIESRLRVNNRPKTEILDYLLSNKFAPVVTIPGDIKKHIKPYQCVMPFDTLTKEQLKEVNYNLSNAYDYLLKLPIYNLTKEKVEKLLSERADMEVRITDLNTKTSGDIWLEELNTFEIEYNKMYKEWLRDNGISKKDLEPYSITTPVASVSDINEEPPQHDASARRSKTSAKTRTKSSKNKKSTDMVSAPTSAITIITNNKLG